MCSCTKASFVAWADGKLVDSLVHAGVGLICNRLDLSFDGYSLLFVNGQNGHNFDMLICMYAC